MSAPKIVGNSSSDNLYIGESDRSDLVKKYQQVLDSRGEGAKKVHAVRVSSPEFKGQEEDPPLGSAVKAVTLICSEEDGQETKVELFVKEMPSAASPTTAAYLKKYNLLGREGQVLNELIPYVRKYCRDKTRLRNAIRCFPEAYHVDDKEIIMGNVFYDFDYYMKPIAEGHDLDEATIVLANFSKFHGVSYGIIQEMGREAVLEKYPCLNEGLLTVKNDKSMVMLEFTRRVAIGLLNNTRGGGKGLKIMGKYFENFPQCLLNTVSVAESEHVIEVMCHGDPWNNNILLGIDPYTNRLINMFLDLQATRIGSPNLDLAYYLFTTVNPTVRKECMKRMLKVYYWRIRNMTEFVTYKRFPIEITFKEFYADFKSKSLLGFWMFISYNVALDVLRSVDPEAQMKKGGHEAVDKAIHGWIKANPAKAEEKARSLVQFCEDYEEWMNEEYYFEGKNELSDQWR